MSDSAATWDGAARSMSEVLAQEAQRLASSRSVYAVIDPHGQLHWKDTMQQRETEAMLSPGVLLSPELGLSSDVMLGSVDPSRGSFSRVTMITTGRTGIRGYRPEPGVAARHPKEYLVNLIGRRVRAALAAGVRQEVSDEELRGNLVLCGVDVDGTEIGLDYWQQQLIGTAFSAASTAAGYMASYRVVGAGQEASVYLPEVHDPMSVDSARVAAWKLTEAANTVEGSSDENPLPKLTSTPGAKEPRWKNESLRSLRKK